MKVLVLGLGSMGKRRIRYLKQLGVEDITGYDIRTDRRQYARDTYGIGVLDHFGWEDISSFDAVLICTPPELHSETAIECVKWGKHFFTEVTCVRDGLDELLKALKDSGGRLVAAPSCTLHYHPCVKKMKALLGQAPFGRPYCFVHHYGEYLPYWHPWESIRDFYVGKRKTSGARDIVTFDMQFLVYLFGDPAWVHGFGANTGALGVDIDDHFEFVARFASGVSGSVLVDVLQRKPNRYFRVVTETGSIIWDDWDEQRLRLIYERQPVGSPDSLHHQPVYIEEELDLAGGQADWAGSAVEKIDFSSAMYVEEMATFLDAVAGKRRYPYTYDDVKIVVDALYQLEANHGDDK
jgi:predicted dehydrogenase